jgi:hypothetical protein
MRCGFTRKRPRDCAGNHCLARLTTVSFSTIVFRAALGTRVICRDRVGC